MFSEYSLTVVLGMFPAFDAVDTLILVVLSVSKFRYS